MTEEHYYFYKDIAKINNRSGRIARRLLKDKEKIAPNLYKCKSIGQRMREMEASLKDLGY